MSSNLYPNLDNTQYALEHLPSWMVAADEGEYLRRLFFAFFGETLNEWDGVVETFHEEITPATASAPFIAYWMASIWGWSWFPSWYLLTDKRRLYGNFGRHIARRGTARGILEFMLDFGVHVRVHVSEQFWGDVIAGEASWGVTGPLVIVVEVVWIAERVNPVPDTYEGVWGDAIVQQMAETLTAGEIEALLRFATPAANIVLITYPVPLVTVEPPASIHAARYDEGRYGVSFYSNQSGGTSQYGQAQYGQAVY